MREVNVIVSYRDLYLHLRKVARLKELAGSNAWGVRAYQSAARLIREEFNQNDPCDPTIDWVKFNGIGESINAEITWHIDNPTIESAMVKSLSDRVNGSNGYIKVTDEVRDVIEKVKLQFMSPGYQTEVCGSYRRKSPLIHDVDLITTLPADQVHEIIETATNLEFIYGGDKKIRFKELGLGLEFDIKMTTPESWAFCLLHSTGPVSLNIQMRKKANELGGTLNEHGLYSGDSEESEVAFTERDIFDMLDMKYLEPEER